MRLGYALIGALVVFDIALALLASLSLVTPLTAFVLLAANPIAVVLVRARAARRRRS